MRQKGPIAIVIVIQNPSGFIDCDCDNSCLSMSLLPCILFLRLFVQTENFIFSVSSTYDVVNIRGTKQTLNQAFVQLLVLLQVEAYGSVGEKGLDETRKTTRVNRSTFKLDGSFVVSTRMKHNTSQSAPSTRPLTPLKMPFPDLW